MISANGLKNYLRALTASIRLTHAVCLTICENNIASGSKTSVLNNSVNLDSVDIACCQEVLEFPRLYHGFSGKSTTPKWIF